MQSMFYNINNKKQTPKETKTGNEVQPTCKTSLYRDALSLVHARI